MIVDVAGGTDGQTVHSRPPCEVEDAVGRVRPKPGEQLQVRKKVQAPDEPAQPSSGQQTHQVGSETLFPNTLYDSSTYRSKHDPEDQPAEAPQDNSRCGGVLREAGQRPERAQKDSQESCFQQLRFPSCIWGKARREKEEGQQGQMITKQSPPGST